MQSMQENPPRSFAFSLNEAIARTLDGLCRTNHNKYCWPSQEKILELLTKYYGYTVSRRTLNYHLRAMEDAKLIRRIRRILPERYGVKRFQSTIYVLTKKAVTWLVGGLRRIKYWYNSFRVQEVAHYNHTGKLCKPRKLPNPPGTKPVRSPFKPIIFSRDEKKRHFEEGLKILTPDMARKVREMNERYPAF